MAPNHTDAVKTEKTETHPRVNTLIRVVLQILLGILGSAGGL